MVDHLVEKGHARLALIGWPKRSLSGDDRASGFVEGLEAAGLSFDARHLIRTENEFAAGREAASVLLDAPSRQRRS